MYNIANVTSDLTPSKCTKLRCSQQIVNFSLGERKQRRHRPEDDVDSIMLSSLTASKHGESFAYNSCFRVKVKTEKSSVNLVLEYFLQCCPLGFPTTKSLFCHTETKLLKRLAFVKHKENPKVSIQNTHVVSQVVV